MFYKSIAIFSSMFLFSSNSYGQVTIQSEPIQLITACINEAIQSGSLRKEGTSVVFSCYGATAQAFFDRLGVNKSTRDTKGVRGGLFRTRWTNNNGNGDLCFQQVEKADGSPTQAYGCQIYLSVGPFINE